MHVLVNTDNNVEGHATLAEQAETAVQGALSRFSDRVTRVEVHISDVNSHKAGEADKRCAMEARLAGRKPVVVRHHAATFPLAISGAAEKLKRSIESSLGKLSSY